MAQPYEIEIPETNSENDSPNCELWSSLEYAFASVLALFFTSISPCGSGGVMLNYTVELFNPFLIASKRIVNSIFVKHYRFWKIVNCMI